MTGMSDAAGNQAGIPTRGRLRVHLKQNPDDLIDLDLAGTEGFILGRSDAKSSYLPDVDLAIFQALDKGVSRRHAALVRYQEQMHVVDLSSVNGTFLNGSRLTPEVPYPLHAGDQLILGDLGLVFSRVET